MAGTTFNLVPCDYKNCEREEHIHLRVFNPPKDILCFSETALEHIVSFILIRNGLSSEAVIEIEKRKQKFNLPKTHGMDEKVRNALFSKTLNYSAGPV